MTDLRRQCEKHSKKEEASTKLRDGVKFDDVAREFSEDKARQGRVAQGSTLGIVPCEWRLGRACCLKRDADLAQGGHWGGRRGEL